MLFNSLKEFQNCGSRFNAARQRRPRRREVFADFDAFKGFALPRAGFFGPGGHACNAGFERNIFYEIAEMFPGFFVRRIGMDDFVAGFEPLNVGFRAMARATTRASSATE